MLGVVAAAPTNIYWTNIWSSPIAGVIGVAAGVPWTTDTTCKSSATIASNLGFVGSPAFKVTWVGAAVYCTPAIKYSSADTSNTNPVPEYEAPPDINWFPPDAELSTVSGLLTVPEPVIVVPSVAISVLISISSAFSTIIKESSLDVIDLNSKSSPTFCLNTLAPDPTLDAVFASAVQSKSIKSPFSVIDKFND